MQGGGYNPAYAGPSAAVVADAAAHHYHESQIEDRQQASLFCCCCRPLKSCFYFIPLRAAIYMFAFLQIVGIFVCIFGSDAVPLDHSYYPHTSRTVLHGDSLLHPPSPVVDVPPLIKTQSLDNKPMDTSIERPANSSSTSATSEDDDVPDEVLIEYLMLPPPPSLMSFFQQIYNVITRQQDDPSKPHFFVFSVRLCCFIFSALMACLSLSAARLPVTDAKVFIAMLLSVLQCIFCLIEFIFVGLWMLDAHSATYAWPSAVEFRFMMFLIAAWSTDGCVSLHFAHVYWSYGVKVSNQRRAIIQSLILRDGGGWTHPSAPMAFSNDQDAALLH
eukprot:GHVS01035078.1.p1 GENE.GHVS01035078.1~~GHVS01035078.1.p1  ORF type:complete len:331 (+),score=47.93 GHVS01035078.1:148-1140(+)